MDYNLEVVSSFTETYISVTNRKWTKYFTDTSIVDHIARSLQIPNVVAEILSSKNIQAEYLSNYLNPKLKNFLPNPNCFIDMDKGVEIILENYFKRSKNSSFR